MDKYLISTDSKLGDNLGIDLISYTADPAIIIKGFGFKSQELKQLKFATDDVKMRIIAPVMIPMDIYRLDEEDGYEYEVQFTIEIIEQLRNDFMFKLNTQNKQVFNVDHTDELAPAYPIETWIVGKEPKADRAFSEFGIEVPTGTMMMMSQFTNKEYYDSIIAADKVGYSIEGFLGLTAIREKLSDIKNKTNIQMEDLMLPDGEHTIGDKVYVVKEGKVTEINDVVALDEDVKPEEVVAEDAVTEEVKPEDAPVTEEVKAEDVIEEEVVAEDAPVEKEVVDTALEIDEDALMAILQPKLDEIYQMMADITARLDSQDQEVIEDAPVAMSIDQRFNNALSFLKN